MSEAEGSQRAGGTTRLGALGRLLAFAGGAVGAGFATKAAINRGEPKSSANAASKPARPETMVLYGSEWRLHSPARVPGQLPAPDDQPAPRGRILDARRREIGSFRAAALPGAAGAFHMHTFDLADGTILGVGGGRLDEGTFAIVGGTGRFSGASGSYTARQSPRDLGGDGTAEFNLTLQAWEA